MNVTDDDQPIGEAPDITGLAWVDYDYKPRPRKPDVCSRCGNDMILQHILQHICTYGDQPNITGIAVIDAATAQAKHAQALQAAVDDIRAYTVGLEFRPWAQQILAILDRHGV